jgi:hypothetical protein
MIESRRFAFRCGAAVFALIATPYEPLRGYHLEVRENGDYFGTFYAAALSPADLMTDVLLWLRLTTGCVPRPVHL